MDLSISMFIHDNNQKSVIMFSPSPLGEFLTHKQGVLWIGRSHWDKQTKQTNLP
jgi:hypothetical protein